MLLLNIVYLYKIVCLLNIVYCVHDLWIIVYVMVN